VSEGSLKVFLHLGRSVASVMREHDAVGVHVLRPALAIVGVLVGGGGAHACESGTFDYMRRDENGSTL